MFVDELHDFNNNVADPKTEQLINLIKENGNAFQTKQSNDALSYDAMKGLIKKEVNNGKQKELLKWVEHHEIIALFLQEIVGGDPKKALALLKKHPYLASVRDPSTGNSPLALVIKNYSFVSADEDKLLKKLVELDPAALALRVNNHTIWDDIGTFAGHKEKYDEKLKTLIKDALKKVKINKEYQKQLADALDKKNYEAVTNLIKEHPELALFQDANKKNLIEYVQETRDSLLNPIRPVVNGLK